MLIVYTPTARAAVGPYSEAVKANGFALTAGQPGLDPLAGATVATDMASQTRQALANIRAIPKAAGTSVKSIVRATIYVTDLQLFADVNSVYAEFSQKKASLSHQRASGPKSPHCPEARSSRLRSSFCWRHRASPLSPRKPFVSPRAQPRRNHGRY